MDYASAFSFISYSNIFGSASLLNYYLKKDIMDEPSNPNSNRTFAGMLFIQISKSFYLLHSQVHGPIYFGFIGFCLWKYLVCLFLHCAPFMI